MYLYDAFFFSLVIVLVFFLWEMNSIVLARLLAIFHPKGTETTFHISLLGEDVILLSELSTPGLGAVMKAIFV